MIDFNILFYHCKLGFVQKNINFFCINTKSIHIYRYKKKDESRDFVYIYILNDN